MQFIVDESTGAAVAEFLQSSGYDVLAITESMPQADDATILARAVADGRIVITNDKDFGELVFRGRQTHPGILLLRLRDESAANRVRIVKSVLDSYGGRLAGHFVVATENSVRVRSVS